MFLNKFGVDLSAYVFEQEPMAWLFSSNHDISITDNSISVAWETITAIGTTKKHIKASRFSQGQMLLF